MKAPALVTIVVLLHVVALGAFVFIQGCGTQSGPAVVEPPPAPVMPARTGTAVERKAPVFQPPVPVEPAPAMTEMKGSKTYIVQKGDSLSKIAKNAGVSSRELAEINGLANPNNIRVGQKLMLPPYAKGVSSSSPSAKAPEKSVSAPAHTSSASGVYVVQSGDSLSKIAAKQGSTVSAIKSANSLTSDKILIGQKLVIPGGRSAPAPTKQATGAPEPERVPMPEVKKASITPTIELQAPTPAPESVESVPAPGDEVFEYTVSEGETLDIIARNFAVLKDDIVSLNGLTSDELQPGQKIKIPPMAY
ncbi:MAG: LysM peptidoglycan-binding domain-containing protein [Verrucomicrobia bacterium]|nr:LysM peptidoglycan-binding domain-containing protein [Verrucomicrobiota bacterium]